MRTSCFNSIGAIIALAVVSLMIHPAMRSQSLRPNSQKQQPREGNLRERDKFFYDRMTSGEIKDPMEIERLGYSAFSSMANGSAMKAQDVPTWQLIGAGLYDGLTYNSGRVRSIAFAPGDINVAYIASTVGGLWKTNNLFDDSVQWVSIGDDLPSPVCSAVAVSPANGALLLVGTGETETGYTASVGRGVFRSTDGGLNWKNVLSPTLMGPATSVIAFAQTNPSLVFVAAPGYFRPIEMGFDTGSYGLFQSKDAGASWVRIDVAPQFHPTWVAIDPTNWHNIYASGFDGSFYFSTDAGASWSGSVVGLDGPVANSVFTIAPSSPNVLYFTAADRYQGSCVGIYRSVDSGRSWAMFGDGFAAEVPYYENMFGQQGTYDIGLTVDPLDPGHVLVGGFDTYEFSDESGIGNLLSFWIDDTLNAVDSGYSHADVHFLTYHAGKLFNCSDGGLSYFDGRKWHNDVNRGLPTLQFVGVDASTDLGTIIGGSQDNGTEAAHGAQSGWRVARGGDGGYAWVSDDGRTCLSTYTGSFLFRSDDGGNTWSDDGQYVSLITNTDITNEGSPFYSRYDLSSDGQIVAFGGNVHVFVSTDGGYDGFLQESTPIGVVTGLRVSPHNPSNMWAGVSNSSWYSNDMGLSWTKSIPSYTGNFVDFAVGNSDSVVYAVVSGLSGDSNAHFLKSTNGGVRWSKVAKNFPKVVAQSIARAKSGQLFVGTDYGVITSSDDGVTWERFGVGMPLVQVLTLEIKGAQGDVLLAGTHGRNAYWMKLEPTGVHDTPQSTFSIGDIYPNPIAGNNASSATLSFTLDTQREVSIALYDNLGREVQVLVRDRFPSGFHQIQIPVKGLMSGDYYVTITSAGETSSRKFTLAR